MIQGDIKVEIDSLKTLLVNRYQPEKIILFGSFAWGKPNRDSDIDLLIIKQVNKPRPYREQEVYKILVKNFATRRMPVDIIVHTPDEIKKSESLGDPFVKEIMTRGKVIYES